MIKSIYQTILNLGTREAHAQMQRLILAPVVFFEASFASRFYFVACSNSEKYSMNKIYSNDSLAPIEAVTPQQGGTTKRGVKADSGK